MLVHESIKKIQEETMKEDGERLSKSGIWEKHLFYSFIPMAKAYCDHYILNRYLRFLDNFNDSPKSKLVFEKLALLHQHHTIIQDEGFYREIFTKDQIEELKESCIKLNKELRPEMVALTFAYIFADNQFGSIGQSDLEIYKRFMDDVKSTPRCFDKPKEWKYLYEKDI